MRPLALARRLGPRPLGLALAALAPAASACRSVTDPPLPGGAAAFTPPAVYARWWAQVEGCSGLRRDVGEIRWFVVPGASTFPSPGGGGDASGYYSRPGSQIVLAGQRQLDGSVVRHEMLHALLRSEAGHPRGAFLDRCAGVVRCETACALDAGPPPALPAGTVRLRSIDVEVGAELAPARAGTPGVDAWYTLTVTATNPTNLPADVALAPLGLAASFGYVVTADPPAPPTPGRIDAFAQTERAYDPSVSRFAPRQTKRYVFDVHVLRDPAAGVVDGVGPGDVRLAPGAYVFRGSYGDGGGRSPAVAAALAP